LPDTQRVDNPYGNPGGDLLYQLNKGFAAKSNLKFVTKSCVTKEDAFALPHGLYMGQPKVMASSKNFQLVAEVNTMGLSYLGDILFCTFFFFS
jgi:hypothetical protein